MNEKPVPPIPMPRYNLYRPLTDDESRTESVLNTLAGIGYEIKFIIPNWRNTFRPLYVLEQIGNVE